MLTLLSLLTVLCLLRLFAALQLLHLPLELFGFAAQHFLFPTLLRHLLGGLLLLRQLLLPARQLFQFFQRIVNLLLACFLSRTGVGFILVLFLVQFQIEQIGQIAPGATATAASAATAALLNLNIAERGFSAQQVLERLLFRRQRILESESFQFFRGWRHGRHSQFHFLDELPEPTAGTIQLTSLAAVGQRLGLIPQFRLHFGKILTVLRRCCFGFGITLDLVEGGRNNFLLAVGDLLFLLIHSATAATACLLRLRIVELEGHSLDEEHVGLSRVLAVFHGGEQAHQIAWHQLEFFQRNQSGGLDFLRTLLLEQGQNFLRQPVDRVVEIHFLQRIIVFRRDLHGHFLNGTDLGVFARAVDVNRRLTSLARLDKVVVTDADGFPLFHHRNVIGAVLCDVNGRVGSVIGGRRKIDRLTFLENDLAARESAIGFNLQTGNRAFHRAQIATWIFGFRRHAGPPRIVERNLDILYPGEIDNFDLVSGRLHATGFHVVLHVFRDTDEHIRVAGAAADRLHRRFFPLAGLSEFRPQTGFGGSVAIQMSGNG